MRRISLNSASVSGETAIGRTSLNNFIWTSFLLALRSVSGKPTIRPTETGIDKR